MPGVAVRVQVCPLLTVQRTLQSPPALGSAGQAAFNESIAGSAGRPGATITAGLAAVGARLDGAGCGARTETLRAPDGCWLGRAAATVEGDEAVTGASAGE